MSLPNLPLPIKGQPVKAWAVRLQRALAPLLGITGDGKYIFVSPGAKGIRIRFNPGADAQKHFQVEKASPTSVTVRGGIYKRIAVGAPNIIGLYDGAGGTITSSDDTITLTGITATTHIITALSDVSSVSDALFPDRLTASSTGSAAYPTGDTGNTIRVLAKVTCEDSVIKSIEEYESGDWEDSFSELDLVSLNYVPNNDDGDMGQTQLRNFEDASNVGASQIDLTSDLVLFKDVSSGLLQYISANVLVSDTISGGSVSFSGVDLDGATWSNHLLDIDHDIRRSHGDLDDLDADDHNGPNYPYFLLGEAGGANKNAWYLRNTLGSQENYCGRSLFVQANLYVDAIYDESATEKRIDVDAAQLFASGAASIDWGAKQILGNWIGTGSFKTADEIVADNGGTYEAAIGDVDNSRSGSFTDGVRVGYICDGSAAAGFYNGDASVSICVGTGATAISTNRNIEALAYKDVNGDQVVATRVVDADLANTPNTGDTDTDDLIAALASVVTTHGLGASS